MKFTVRHYRPGDEDEIIAMFNEVFGQKRDLAHWRWKYRDNPNGSFRISVAVSDDGKLGSHYAGYPLKICSCVVSKKPIEMNTYQLGDKMTRKAYRSLGFGKTALIARAYAHFKKSYMDDDTPFCYGFAAGHSLRFGVKVLQYADMEPVPYRRISLSNLKRLVWGRLRRILSPASVVEVSSVDSRWTDFFYSVAADYLYLIKRDAPYLTWRYLQRPDRQYFVFSVEKKSRLTGWSVFFREGKKVIWGDALFRPGDSESVKVLLRHVSGHTVAQGAEFVECWFPPRPRWWDATLELIGFIRESEPNGLHFTLPMYREAHAVETAKKYFYYTMGDSDLF